MTGRALTAPKSLPLAAGPGRDCHRRPTDRRRLRRRRHQESALHGAVERGVADSGVYAAFVGGPAAAL